MEFDRISLNVRIKVHRIKRASSTHICNTKKLKTKSPLSAEKSSCRKVWNSAGDWWCNHEVISAALLMSQSIKCCYLWSGWGECNDTMDSWLCLDGHILLLHHLFIQVCITEAAIMLANPPTPAFGQLILHFCRIPKWLVKYLIFIIIHTHTEQHINLSTQ